MSDSEKCKCILAKYPDVETIDELLDHCRSEFGQGRYFWHIYFAAKQAGRHLSRRIDLSPIASDSTELASILFGLCDCNSQKAYSILDRVYDLNTAGNRIAWHTESFVASHGWEMSAAQELLDTVSGLQAAKQLVAAMTKAT